MRLLIFFAAAAILPMALSAAFEPPRVSLEHPDPEPHPADAPHIVPDTGSGPHIGSDTGSDTQQYAPASKPNSCLSEGGHCDEIIEKAADFMKELAEKLSDLGDAGSTTTSTMATMTTPAPLPNYNIVTAINMYEYLPLLDKEEQDMWNSDLLCFFANIEGYYTAAAANSTATSSTAASTTPAPTSSESISYHAFIRSQTSC